MAQKHVESDSYWIDRELPNPAELITGVYTG